VADATRIALSGSSGLIGSAFTKKLPKKIQIVGSLQMSLIPLSEINNSIESLSKLGVEAFLHLGWPASSFPENYRNTADNFDALQKTVILKEACLRANIMFIGIGSGIDKKSEMENFYQLTKFTCREMFSAQIDRKEITWVRPFYIFDDNSWPEFLHRKSTSPIQILDDSPRDFIHLDDVVSALFEIIQKKIMGEIDLGTGRLVKPSNICTAFGRSFHTEANSAGVLAKNNIESAQKHSKLNKCWSPTRTLALLKE